MKKVIIALFLIGMSNVSVIAGTVAKKEEKEKTLLGEFLIMLRDIRDCESRIDEANRQGKDSSKICAAKPEEKRKIKKAK